MRLTQSERGAVVREPPLLSKRKIDAQLGKPQRQHISRYRSVISPFQQKNLMSIKEHSLPLISKLCIFKALFATKQ